MPTHLRHALPGTIAWPDKYIGRLVAKANAALADIQDRPLFTEDLQHAQRA